MALYSILTVLFFAGAMIGLVVSLGAILKCLWERVSEQHEIENSSTAKPVVDDTKQFFRRYVVKYCTGTSGPPTDLEAAAGDSSALQLEEEGTVREGTGCSICLSGLSPGDKVLEVTCGHVFHEGCVGQWFQTQSSCPMCRADLNLLTKLKCKSRRTKSFGDIPNDSLQISAIGAALSDQSLRLVSIPVSPLIEQHSVC